MKRQPRDNQAGLPSHLRDVNILMHGVVGVLIATLDTDPTHPTGRVNRRDQGLLR